MTATRKELEEYIQGGVPELRRAMNGVLDDLFGDWFKWDWRDPDPLVELNDREAQDGE